MSQASRPRSVVQGLIAATEARYREVEALVNARPFPPGDYGVALCWSLLHMDRALQLLRRELLVCSGSEMVDPPIDECSDAEVVTAPSGASGHE